MNPNLPRWMYSSLAQHFKTVADGIPLNYYVEGVDEPESSDFQNDAALFKMDGPTAYEGSAAAGDEWYAVDLFILLTDIVQLTNDNAYDIHRWAGVFQSSMIDDALTIYKYGDGPDDDASLIGCLVPDNSLRNNVRVVNYGQVDKDLRIKQVSVNGRFLLHC